MREVNFILRKCTLAFFRRIKGLAWIWEWVSGAVARRRIGVASGADGWYRTAEELLAVAWQTGCVLRIVGDIRKGIVSLAHLFPV
jgi:hypothetical protein